MNRLCDEAQSILETTDIQSNCQLFKGWWSIKDCQKNKNSIFVFGDNDRGFGKKGQAVIRDCKNSHGIPTKKYPSFADTSYYTDDEYEENVSKIIDAVEDLIIKYGQFNSDRIFFPEDGLGTGLSKLDTKAPRTLEFLNHLLSEVFGIEY